MTENIGRCRVLELCINFGKPNSSVFLLQLVDIEIITNNLRAAKQRRMGWGKQFEPTQPCAGTQKTIGQLIGCVAESYSTPCIADQEKVHYAGTTDQ